jgi:hypothetical protein
MDNLLWKTIFPLLFDLGQKVGENPTAVHPKPKNVVLTLKVNKLASLKQYFLFFHTEHQHFPLYGLFFYSQVACPGANRENLANFQSGHLISILGARFLNGSCCKADHLFP